MAQPKTEAGVALAAWVFGVGFVANPTRANALRDSASAAIVAIEAEARAAVLADVQTLLDIVDSINDCHGCFDLSSSDEDRAAVARIRAEAAK